MTFEKDRLDNELEQVLCEEVQPSDEFMERMTEWEKIDNLVAIYQKAFGSDGKPATQRELEESDKAATELLKVFTPFFHKYLTIITTGDIKWNNPEQRLFVSMFMETKELRYALYGKNKVDKDLKQIISQRFNFIKETYGHYDEDEIMTDLHYLFFIMAQRYKKTNRSFCCYLYNAYRFEVFRHIQKLLRNPLNIHYRSISYDTELEVREIAYECDMDEKISTIDTGMPSITWIFGQNCSEEFVDLTPLERKIIAKYYIEQKADKQIAKELGIHLNTCNNKRHQALLKIAKAKNIDPKEIKRCRNSGVIKS